MSILAVLASILLIFVRVLSDFVQVLFTCAQGLDVRLAPLLAVPVAEILLCGIRIDGDAMGSHKVMYKPRFAGQL